MPILTMDMSVVCRNLAAIDRIVRGHGAAWTLVTKVLSGWPEALAELAESGVRSVADSRLANLNFQESKAVPEEIWYLRPPALSEVSEIVTKTHVSLNSELNTVRALSMEASRVGRVHQVVVMVELGDLREGVSAPGLGEFIEQCRELPGVGIAGIGSNLGCLSGAIPTVDQFSQLAMYRELMELKFGIELPLISAGTSAVLPLAMDRKLPTEINHFRIGESVFLGSDLVNGGVVPGLDDRGIELMAEVVEVREKDLDLGGELQDIGPFERLAQDSVAGGRGVRAVVSLGQLETAIQGLTCVDSQHSLVGASSDLAVIAIGEEGAHLSVGDWVKFRPSYGALVRLTSSPYVEKRIVGMNASGAGNPACAGFLLPPVLGGRDGRLTPGGK